MSRPESTGSALITRDQALLVIIDVQERLMPAVINRDKVIENTKRLLAAARILNIPVIYTEQEKLGPTVAEVKAEMPASGAVPKLAFNCFLSDAFAEKVMQARRDTLIIGGVEAHICVAQTALWAAPRFHVQVVSDAMSSRTPENLSVATERLRAAGITVTSTEMVIYELLQRAGTDEFKQILPLVK